MATWRWRVITKVVKVVIEDEDEEEETQRFQRKQVVLEVQVDDWLPSHPWRYEITRLKGGDWYVKGAVRRLENAWDADGNTKENWVETGRWKRVERDMDDAELLQWLVRKITPEGAVLALMRLKGVVDAKA